MTYEDFTTYTEDDPNSRVSVYKNEIDVVDLARNEVAHVYKDFGTDYFKTFTHKVDAKPVSGEAFAGGNVGAGVFWMVYNSANRYYILLEFYCPSYIFLLSSMSDGTHSDYYNGYSYGTMYYFTILRTDTEATAKIYSDSARTNLIDTLTVPVDSGLTFDYLYAMSGVRYPVFTAKISYNIYNLDIGLKKPVFTKHGFIEGYARRKQKTIQGIDLRNFVRKGY